jgi:chromosome segregation ATPase
MFRKRALQELNDIVTTTPPAPEADQPDTKVVTVQRIQDLLQEVGVDPGDDPVEAARTFLASVDNKLPSAFGSFRLGRAKQAAERADEPEAMWGRGRAVPVEDSDADAASEFDAAAFEAAGFAPGTFDSGDEEAPATETPVEAVVVDEGIAPTSWEQPRPHIQPNLPDWLQVPGASRVPSEPVVAAAPDEPETDETTPADVETVGVAFAPSEGAEPQFDESQFAEAEYVDTQFGETQVAEAAFVAPEFGETSYGEPQYAESAPWIADDSEPAAVQSDELATANARIEELQAAVMERAAQRDALRDELEVTENRLRQLETTVAERERDCTELTTRIAELEDASERAVLESADITSFEFKGELAPTFEELATAITALESTLAEREQQQAHARSVIAQHELNIAELTAQRNEAYGSIASAREREQELHDALEELRAENAAATDDARNADARRAELARLQAELDRVEASLRTTLANETAASDELARRRVELTNTQEQLVAVRDALRVATTECEATERQLSLVRRQTADAEAARDGARAEAERVIELAMRQAQALRADAERQAEAARILHDAANEAIALQTDAQRQSDVVRERAEQAIEAIRVEREEAATPDGEHLAPAILSALITRVASIESHLSQYREQASDASSHEVEAATSAE